ncbi:acetyl-CoA carboxylase biotin carboxylase subunit family protein [Paenibacillus taichungensis]|uniref:ATP-grasp domain-containing protein n=1 Tax=Paenibacillus taichungensis TaxID=484184 RepID=UPI0038D0F6D6
MNNKTVILVESGCWGSEIPAIKELGYNVIYITTGLTPFKKEYNELTLLTIESRNIINTSKLKQMIIELMGEHEIIAMFSTSDFFIHPIAMLNEELEFYTLNSETVRDFVNKDLFRKKQLELNYNVPEFYALETLEDGIQVMNQSSRSEWIFKPVNGNESVGVKLISTVDELKECIKGLNNLSRATGNMILKKYLLEEYIPGEVYSCEFIVSKSRVEILGVTDRLISKKPIFAELGYTFPLEDDHISNKIIELTEQFIRDFNYDFGPCHIEYIVNEQKEIYICEVNARLAGPPNHWMMNKAFDTDILRHISNLYITGNCEKIRGSSQNIVTCLEITSPINGFLKKVTTKSDWTQDGSVEIVVNQSDGRFVKKASSNTDIVARILTIGNDRRQSHQLAFSVFQDLRLDLDVAPVLEVELPEDWIH